MEVRRGLLMKVRIFGEHDVVRGESSINRWVEKHPDARIDRILQSTIPPGEGLYGAIVISI